MRPSPACSALSISVSAGPSWRLKNARASTGVKKIARKSEASNAVTSVNARARKKTAVMPPRKTSGTKTTIGVSVEPVSAGVNSLMALNAASRGVERHQGIDARADRLDADADCSLRPAGFSRRHHGGLLSRSGVDAGNGVAGFALPGDLLHSRAGARILQTP